MSQYVIEQLRSAISQRKAIIVVGAGVSLSASENYREASWQGLLESGLRRCVDVGFPPPGKGWMETMTRLLRIGDLQDWLLIAEQISTRLGAPSDKRFTNWIKDCFGAIELRDTRLINAIYDLKCPIITTNYDDLIEKTTKMSTLTWKTKDNIKKLLETGEGVFHIHGCYKDPETVILSYTDYKVYKNDEYRDVLQKSLTMFNSLVFIGCGQGVNDPNISSLIEWVSKNMRDQPHEHYRLMLKREYESERQNQHKPSVLYSVPYGVACPELIDFVQSLRPVEQPRDAPKFAFGTAAYYNMGASYSMKESSLVYDSRKLASK